MKTTKKHTAKPERANAFNGEEQGGADEKKTKSRISVEQYLLNNPGRHTVPRIVAATGLHIETVRRRIHDLVDKGDAINHHAGRHHAEYQHREHWTREQNINRREPITNAGMPNGSQAYWAKHMAAFRAEPRQCAGKASGVA